MIIAGLEVIRGNPDPRQAVEVAPPGKLDLTYGDTLRITTGFNYRGPATDITLYGSVGQRKVLIGFDEILSNEKRYRTPETRAVFVPVEASVDIPITADIPPKADYDIYCKIKEYPEAGMPEVDDVIDITGIPPSYELLEETIYPFAYIYEGEKDGVVYTFKTDPFSPDSWVTGRLASYVEDEVRKAGGKMLEMRVYVDKTPLLWKEWRIEAIGAPPKTTEGVAAIPWVGIIIAGLLLLGIIIALTLLVDKIAGLFKRKPGLDQVKVGWTKETLILCIQDSEEYWERDPTPVETLEGMSEEELRHYLNQIAEEEVPPTEGLGLGLAIAAAGVLGLGALAIGAYAMGRPRETE